MSQGFFPPFAGPQVPRQEGEGQEVPSSLGGVRPPKATTAPVRWVHAFSEPGQLHLQCSQDGSSTEPGLTPASPCSFLG